MSTVSRRYELLKDLPDYRAGEIFQWDGVFYKAINKCSEGTNGRWPPMYVENNPEWFREIKENKEWEVSAYKSSTSGKIYPAQEVNDIGIEDVEIHSVKRLSDGEVFTVGDFIRVDDMGCRKGWSDAIEAFLIVGEVMVAQFPTWRQPLKYLVRMHRNAHVAGPIGTYGIYSSADYRTADILGIKFDGTRYTHPMTNSHKNIADVLTELRTIIDGERQVSATVSDGLHVTCSWLFDEVRINGVQYIPKAAAINEVKAFRSKYFSKLEPDVILDKIISNLEKLKRHDPSDLPPK